MSTRPVLPSQPSLDTFGAPKRNWGPVKDPSIVHTADDINVGAANLTAVSFPAIRAWATVSAAGALIKYKSVWGEAPGPYAPVPNRASTGSYTLTWPSSVPDLLDGTMQPFAPLTSMVSANTSGRVATSRQSGQVTTVETHNAAGGAAADAAFTVLVFG